MLTFPLAQDQSVLAYGRRPGHVFGLCFVLHLQFLFDRSGKIIIAYIIKSGLNCSVKILTTQDLGREMIFFNKSSVYQNSQAFDRRCQLHPLIQNILDNVLIFIKLRFQIELDGIVTCTVSTVEEDVILRRKSSTHREGRAFDLSVRRLSEDQIDEIKIQFTNIAGQLGAINKDGMPCLIVDHDCGLGRHLHFQISKDVAKNFKD